jgi:hypothetical protein
LSFFWVIDELAFNQNARDVGYLEPFLSFIFLVAFFQHRTMPDRKVYGVMEAGHHLERM